MQLFYNFIICFAVLSLEEADSIKEATVVEVPPAVSSDKAKSEKSDSAVDEDDVEEEDDDDDTNTEIMSNQMSPISQNSPTSVSYTQSPYVLTNGSVGGDRNLLSLDKLELRVKQRIHSRKFRE
jgi:hypothetical protein